jgi:hypothetical protein
VRRRPSVPPTVEESEPSFREALAALWQEPPKVKLMILAAAMVILPLAFLAGFFLFGAGWGLRITFRRGFGDSLQLLRSSRSHGAS